MTRRERIAVAVKEASAGRYEMAVSVAQGMMAGRFFSLSGVPVILTYEDAKAQFAGAGMAPDDFDAMMCEAEGAASYG